jgi:PPOX class probable F420-dependent enzyme
MRQIAERKTTTFPGRYLSITSFRRDGTGKATPVWFVQEDGRLLVETDAGSFKVQRIRRNPSVTNATRVRGRGRWAATWVMRRGWIRTKTRVSCSCCSTG